MLVRWKWIIQASSSAVRAATGRSAPCAHTLTYAASANVTLGYDCTEEAPKSAEAEARREVGMSVDLVAACKICQMKTYDRYLPRLALTDSCVECLWPPLRRYIAHKRSLVNVNGTHF